MSEQVIVIGGGCHAKVVIDCIHSSGDFVFGILDDRLVLGATVLNIPVLGKIEDYIKYADKQFIIAIGSNAIRRRIAENLKVNWHTVVHPGAFVSKYAQIGAGNVVMPNAVINAGAFVGNHCIINSGAVVEHDNQLEDYVHISPSASLGGTVSIGKETHIGIGATVKNNIHICDNCCVGAGAVVVKNITEKGTYAGIPAVRIK